MLEENKEEEPAQERNQENASNGKRLLNNLSYIHPDTYECAYGRVSTRARNSSILLK